ncbi:DNA-(apurinic or apyrimidinic site) lyase [Leucobacter luti]|uniref:bifunctional DNA-formamidopyrimidine glycosylase/DNA-(apurinic or apyrimidinic site) lyase n=1 Tax=Leucobacter luti TaxID=340320 RepID=UPI001043FF4E|nr:bifunctional DNA-formamidopyrimidine glycosylase/DNA-(apurinic or apyrimidinic site) lyase [Leucobacter luti]MCW2288015.1 formamidopyrimidine-DNA glycosylase [Leucobacter luti]TCK45823.1 DNA-(apurinic or apyrimidinic site) lyase [Leucobacter luti]
MPELPEVEVVRAGLAPAVTGARVIAVEVRDARALKRHALLSGDDGLGGHGVTLPVEAAAERAIDFERRVTGLQLGAPERRGKFMWVPVARSGSTAGIESGSGEAVPDEPWALLAHLGMSGQLLLRDTAAEDDRHVRIRLWIEHPDHGELRLDFADQRLFGSLALDRLRPTSDDGSLLPVQAARIARDPLDPHFDDAVFVAAVRSRSSGIKKLILDQALVSGVGNIYADEALWRARLHPDTAGRAISVRKLASLLGAMRDVFAQALAEGGTSFDEQYVNVNGQAGYFSHSLNSYGRTGEPCPRCGDPIRRVPFGGRSSHFCPRCQRHPRQTPQT